METTEIVHKNLKHLKQLVFEVTESCNLSCKYCGLSDLYKGYVGRKNRTLSFDKVKLIIDYIFKLREIIMDSAYPLVVSFYGGEPLLNMKLIVQTVSYIKTIGFKGVTFSMTTNGILLHKYMDFLIKEEFHLLISLDGNEANQSYRTFHNGENSFKSVYKNIVLLKERYPKYFEKNVEFNSVIHNKNSIQSVFEFINTNFNKIPMMDSINTLGIEDHNKLKFKEMYQNPYESLLNSDNYENLEKSIFIRSPRIRNLMTYLFYNSGNTFQTINHLLSDDNVNSTRYTGTCSPFAKKMFITAKGYILQCEKISHEFALGKIVDGKVELNFESVAKKQNKLIDKLSSQCHNCYLKDNGCMQCVYMVESIKQSNPDCDNFCTKQEFEKYERKTLDHLRENPSLYEKILNEVTFQY